MIITKLAGLVLLSNSRQTTLLNSYNRFADMLTSKAMPFLKSPHHNQSYHDLDYLLRTLFEREISLVRAATPVRATIQDAKGYAPLDLFRLIDVGDRNSFGYQEYFVYFKYEVTYHLM